MGFDRRSVLHMLGAGALAGGLSHSIAKALALPANNKTGTLADVEHIVVLMQENRSFDHYFGTLSGVRGFGDPRAMTLPDGNPVFHQPDGAGGSVLPFHPIGGELGLKFIRDLPHDWATTHQAWNDGRYDRWVPAKTPLTMAYLERADIPYHYALADAFTICDAYHCSMLGPTDPNRYHLFTGSVGNSGAGGGPVVDNSEAGYRWPTFPESLEAAGISWKIYQDEGLGLDEAGHWGETDDPHIGTYGDNSLLYFEQYRQAKPGSPLYDNARTGTRVAEGGTLFDHFRRDVSTGCLPQVSWLVAPEAYSEHPNWPANYGAYYISHILDALTANPAIWSKTALFIAYDENDGFFDHVVPPTPPQTPDGGLSTVPTADEIYPGGGENPSGPYGLGPRVPMLVISPWSKGGWVNSEVFDHTSLIRFVQKRFGTVRAPLLDTPITAWRSAVCGDLTSAFNFANPNPVPVKLPSTAGYLPADGLRHDSCVPTQPLRQTLPAQEPGTRPARGLPYELNVEAGVRRSRAEVALEFVNSGSRTAVFQVRPRQLIEGPRTYTVSPGSRLSDVWSAGHPGSAHFGLFVHGPNGFFRGYEGGFGPDAADIRAAIAYDVKRNGVALSAFNAGGARCAVEIVDCYTALVHSHTLDPGARIDRFFALDAHVGWYDFVLRTPGDLLFRQQLAGHLETGRDSTTEPPRSLIP